MHGRRHSREFKLQVCRQLATGEKRPAQILREHHLSSATLAQWRAEYAQRGETAFTAHVPDGEEALRVRIAELERFCGQLALENEIIKKALRNWQSGKGTP